MSAWTPENGANAKDKLFCPQCGRELLFGSKLNVPELVKCDGCKAQFCMIGRGIGHEKPPSTKSAT